MKKLPDFQSDLYQFVREEARAEADNILKCKDPPLSEFDLKSLDNFSYKSEMEKLLTVAPLLMACIAGTISSQKSASLCDLSRKGFGGSRQSEPISLMPAMVQTASCILRNRHPNSISTVACVNSVNSWLLHIPHQFFFLNNSLGIGFR